MQREERALTNAERIEYWRMCCAIIDMKRRYGAGIGKEEAFRRFAMWTDLPVALSKMLFDVMEKQSAASLSKARPRSIPKYPRFRYIEESKPRADKGKPRPHATKKAQLGLPKTI